MIQKSMKTGNLVNELMALFQEECSQLDVHISNFQATSLKDFMKTLVKKE